ncbi:hypothetical protein [Actinotalea sp. Marseille-Q4924]|uniref:hypothetical protein n=1 Tax=Actinotalea sp. Marseille-Q4924 TaxID=2866571 RepID=UPI001CE437EB|nr:hypothetical protein [Actinotalea sp. Marseille-Q4924]
MRTSSLIAATGGAALLLGAAGPAVAGEQPLVDQRKVLEQRATFSWVEEDHGDTVGRAGTVHTGGVLVEKAYGNTDLFGYLVDWDCEPGEVPTAEGPGGCVMLKQYEIASAGAVFELDVRSGSATLTGELAFFDLEMEEEQFQLPVDIAWTSDGKPIRSRVHHSDLSPTSKVQVHQQGVTWAGTDAAGSIGALVLGDAPGEVIEHGLWSADSRYFFWQRGGDVPPDDGGGMG